MKEKGILLPIFSLPSKYGIGDFGKEAYEFVDILKENNVKYWEILPINACNFSPYSPYSYYALNENYISLEKLKERGLIENFEERESDNKVIYDDFKEKYFEEAFSKFQKSEEYYKFIESQEINEYAEFATERYGHSKEYYLFLQYIAHEQWIAIKKYANSNGVEIIGDMPVYPVFDSTETKYHPECFEMENGEFTFESGTPPDYFNSDGQKWNSPVYNVKNIKENNYTYFLKRFKKYAELFDKIRVDYFRGYDSFFRIPLGKSGRDGEYVDGLSYGFFDELLKLDEINLEDLIIEDLGDIRDETIALRRHYGFTRQKIMQFSIDLDNFYDKDNESENVVAFPGNHDCNTIYGWYKSLNDEYKWKLQEFLRKNECYDLNVNIGMMQYSMKCKAKIVILMVQDILGLDESSRVNIPGTPNEENWAWKLKDFDVLKREIKYFG